MDDEHVLRPNMYPTVSQQSSHCSRTLSPTQHNLLAHLERLKFFLATAPSRWSALDVAPTSHQHPALNRFLLPSGEYVTCVLWSGLYHITGTDIVRALVFRFEAFGRPVRNIKKFEEGIFSDLRNLKPGHDACLEEPKSPFLDLLFKYQCIRTQKKQKVFYWFSVPHDRLFLDALERDLKREKMGHESTTAIMSEPAASFTYDPKRSLFEQFCTKPAHVDSESDFAQAVYPIRTESIPAGKGLNMSSGSLPELEYGSVSSSLESISILAEPPTPPPSHNPVARTPFFNMFALFEGSPTYKQRRKKAPKTRRCLEEQVQARIASDHFLAKPCPFRMENTGNLPSATNPAQPSLQMQYLATERLAEHQHDQEQALIQVHDRGEPGPEMEIDAGSSPTSQYMPDGPLAQQYSYEDDQTYANDTNPVHCAHTVSSTENSAYGTPRVPLPNAGYSVHDYSYDSSSESHSSTEVVRTVTSHSLPVISVSTSHSYYEVQHQHPLSAPSHRMAFDIYPPENVARRPRSMTPSLPTRTPHVRRPSTANEAESAHEVALSWRSQVSRGYHPYAPRPASTYSSSGSSATSSMLAVQQEYEYDASPFAYMVNGNAEVYPTEQAYDGATYGASPESPAVEQQQRVQYEYAAAAYSSTDPEPEAGTMYQMTPPAPY